MQNVNTTQVLIVGAGPVGLTLAIDLARRGVPCRLIEEQPTPRQLPKMERLNARSMEIYRRLGLADAIRRAGAPADARMDCLVSLSMAEEPLVRLHYPGWAEAQIAIDACNDGSLPLEPAHLISQYTLEPLLLAAARKEPNLQVDMGCALRSFTQDSDGVSAKLEFADGKTEEVRVSYMVGTDGGRSTVRKALGIQLQGDGALARKNQVFVRCPGLWEAYKFPQARMIMFANEDQSILSLQDSLEHFVFHTSRVGSNEELASHVRDTLKIPLEFEILASTEWTLHLLLAERYMDRRVLLAGDSVHLVIPTGGLGLNTGIGDAIDLSWKLAATLQGWGGSLLLNSYEQERRAIGKRNIEGSRYAAQGQITWRSAVRPNIADNTPEGRGVRGAVTRLASTEQRKTHEQVGTELGYRYDSSSVICPDEPGAGDWPPDLKEFYIPTSRPGARLPNIRLADGRALQDCLGTGYTLLKFHGNSDTRGIEAQMLSYGIPFQCLQIADSAAREIAGRDLVLLRPDMHVCWRGNQAPADPLGIVDIVTGRKEGALANTPQAEANEIASATSAKMNW